MSENTVSIIISSLGLLATIFIFYSQINRQFRDINKNYSDISQQYTEINQKINKLLTYRKGRLNKEQAYEFAAIYIDYIQAELHRKVEEMIISISNSKHDVSIHDIMAHKDDIKKSLYRIRAQTIQFYLINDVTFKQFIEDASKIFKENIINAENETNILMKNFEIGLADLIELRTFAHNQIEKVGNHVIDIVKDELSKMYK